MQRQAHLQPAPDPDVTIPAGRPVHSLPLLLHHAPSLLPRHRDRDRLRLSPDPHRQHPFQTQIMKPDWTHLDRNRRLKGEYASPAGATYGMFVFTTGKLSNDRLRVIAVDATLCPPEDIGHGWEHVSVSAWIMPKKKGQPPIGRTPTWEEMDRIKHKFWDDHETVVQFHPPEDVKVNFTANCLHLWKCTTQDQPLPPPILVGPPTADAQEEPTPEVETAPEQAPTES